MSDVRSHRLRTIRTTLDDDELLTPAGGVFRDDVRRQGSGDSEGLAGIEREEQMERLKVA
jgi:hypothetical protein